MLIPALFMVAKKYKKYTYQSTNEWMKKTGIPIHWNIIQP